MRSSTSCNLAFNRFARKTRILIPLAVGLAGVIMLLAIFSPAPVVSAQAVITNGSFDSGISGWTNTAGSSCWQWENNILGRDGVYWGRLEDSGCGSSYLYQEFSVSQSFYMSVTVYRGVGSGDSQMRVMRWTGGDWEECDEVTRTPNGNWIILPEHPIDIPFGCEGAGTYQVRLYSGLYDEVTIWGDEEPPPPPPPPPPGPVNPGAICGFNYTGTITSTNGTTETATYSYTVAANLLQNHSFETANQPGAQGAPLHWVVLDYQPPLGFFANLFYGESGLIIQDARTGNRFIRPGGDNHLTVHQQIELQRNGVYQYGLYYKCGRTSGACSDVPGTGVGLAWNNIGFGGVMLSSSHSPTYYQTISFTHIVNNHQSGANVWFEMWGPIANWQEDEIFIDDAWVFPVDEDGELICDPSFYPVPPPISSVPPVNPCEAHYGNVCFPPVLDASCWQCVRPVNWLSFGEWISWLFCHIRNLFFCHLYHWLLMINNWVVGIFSNLLSFLQWLPSAFNGFSGFAAQMWNWLLSWIAGRWNNLVAFVNWLPSAVNWVGAWLANIWNAAWEWIGGLWGRITTGFANYLRLLFVNLLNSSLVQTVYQFILGLGYAWDFFMGMVQFFINTARNLFLALVEVVVLFWDLVNAIRQAFFTTAYEWDFMDLDISQVSREAAMADMQSRSPESGFWTDTQIMYIFLLGLATGDSILGYFGMGYIQWLIIGAMAFGLVLWTLRKWDVILPM